MSFANMKYRVRAEHGLQSLTMSYVRNFFLAFDFSNSLPVPISWKTDAIFVLFLVIPTHTQTEFSSKDFSASILPFQWGFLEN